MEKLSKHSPEIDKLAVLARRLKKADDVLRMFADDYPWKQLRHELWRIREEVARLHTAQAKGDVGL